MVFQIQLAKRQDVVPITRDYIIREEARLRDIEGGQPPAACDLPANSRVTGRDFDSSRSLHARSVGSTIHSLTVDSRGQHQMMRHRTCSARCYGICPSSGVQRISRECQM